LAERGDACRHTAVAPGGEKPFFGAVALGLLGVDQRRALEGAVDPSRLDDELRAVRPA